MGMCTLFSLLRRPRHVLFLWEPKMYRKSLQRMLGNASQTTLSHFRHLTQVFSVTPTPGHSTLQAQSRVNANRAVAARSSTSVLAWDLSLYPFGLPACFRQWFQLAALLWNNITARAVGVKKTNQSSLRSVPRPPLPCASHVLGMNYPVARKSMEHFNRLRL